jgi:hypothetical protein
MGDDQCGQPSAHLCSDQQSLTYASAGTQTVAYDWSLGAAGAYWVKLYINNPNHQYFTPVNITLTCT